jgi:phosphatidylglycerol:prolipoprotein diacylglycerol transferase
MRPVLFAWRRIRFYPYTVMLYVGIVLGVTAGTYAARSWGMNANRVYVALLILLLPALLGARLLFVATHWEGYRPNPGTIFRRADSGAALDGALGLTFPLSLPLLYAMGLSIGSFWDVATIAILIGVAIIKLGCLMNGCCAGRPSEAWWAVRSRNHQGVVCRRLPSQLLESGLAIILLIGVLTLHRELPFAGAGFLLALGGYGAGRWWLEATRESAGQRRPVIVNRGISLALLGISAVSFLVGWVRR